MQTAEATMIWWMDGWHRYVLKQAKLAYTDITSPEAAKAQNRWAHARGHEIKAIQRYWEHKERQ